MRYKALNYYTGALPLIDADAEFGGTIMAMIPQTAILLRSVQNGIKYELDGLYKKLSERRKRTINIILTGGDSVFFLILY